MVTQTHSPFETLARVIESLDDDGRSVRRTEAAGSGGDGSLRATVDVSVGGCSADAGLEPTEATVDGGLSVSFCAPSFPDPAAALPAGHPPVSATPADVWVDGESVVVTLEVAIGATDRSADAGGSTGGVDAARVADESPRLAGGDAVTDDGGADVSAPSAGGDVQGDADAADGEGGTDGEENVTADEVDGEPSPLAAVRDGSVPAYDDTPYLRRLYETCETFAEMSDRIDMDVSAETVRRYMTEAGVHSPTSYETTGRSGQSSGGDAADAADGSGSPSATGSDTEPTVGGGGVGGAAGDETRSVTAGDDDDAAAPLPDEQLVADGIGLPEELTLHDVVDAVVDARTVHEVQREVGLGYDRTRQLLTQLNVLDLVVGRVSGEPDRTVTVDVVADRIRQCAPDAA